MNANLTGRFVAMVRKRRGLSQEDLAERIGVTHHAVTSWESGRRAMHRAVVDRFLALTEALDCSGAEREDLYGAVRADRFLSDLWDAPDAGAVCGLFATSMPRRMRDWLIGVFSRNQLLIDPREHALTGSGLAHVREKMRRAVEHSLQDGEGPDQLHVLLLFLGRGGRTAPPEETAAIRALLARSFERLGNPVARRDVAIALAEMGEAGVLRRYVDRTENDAHDREINLRWIGTIDGEPLPGPEVLRRLVEIVEGYLADPPPAPLIELTLRTIGQLLAWQGAAACDAVSTWHRLAGILEQLAARREEGIRRRAGDVREQLTGIAGSLMQSLRRWE